MYDYGTPIFEVKKIEKVKAFSIFIIILGLF